MGCKSLPKRLPVATLSSTKVMMHLLCQWQPVLAVYVQFSTISLQFVANSIQIRHVSDDILATWTLFAPLGGYMLPYLPQV